MTPARAHPALRLVNSADAPPLRASPRGNSVRLAPSAPAAAPSARRAVVDANRLASGMSPADARWVFALRAASALEGGLAGIIRPEVRERLVHDARKLGLRPFDANLIIAIVQDGRRSGVGALNPDVESRLTLVRPADEPKPTPRWVGILIGLTIMGLTLTYVVCSWIARG